jgi:MFS family permease
MIHDEPGAEALLKLATAGTSTGAGNVSDASCRTRPRRGIDLLIVSSGLLTGLSMSGLTPILPRIAAALAPSINGASGYMATMVVAVVGLSIMIAAPLAGMIARHFSCASILIASFTCYAGAALASSLAPSLEWLVIARFIQGLGVAIGVTTLLALAGTLYPARARDRLLGLHMGGSALALLVLLPLAGILGDINWRLAPLIGLLSLFHLALTVRERRQLDVRLSARRQLQDGLTSEERYQSIIIALLAFIIGVALYSAPAFVPFKLAAVGMTSGTAIGLISTAAVASSALGSFCYARIAACSSRRGVYLLALPCCCAGALIIWTATNPWLVAAGQLVSGAGGGLLVAHIYADCAQRFRPELRARATGIVKSSSFAGLFAGPLILQAVVTRTSIDAAFLAIAMVVVAALGVSRLGGNRPLDRSL